MSTKLSLCIPVHNTEGFFSECLLSLQNQNLSECSLKQSDIELVIINDLSTGTDSLGRDCKKIIKDFKHQNKFKINYVVHYKKTPLLETRRELILESHSPYIMCVDSDDILEPDCISILYNLITSTGADIVQGNAKAFTIVDGRMDFNEALQSRVGNVFNGILENEQIIHSWAVENKTSAFLWAKIMTRDLYVKAFDQLLFSDCNIITDLPLYFFIALLAKKYVGTNENVYLYRNNSGITSTPVVKDMENWERVCSMASGFSNLVLWINNKTQQDGKSPIADDVRTGIQMMFLKHLHNSVIQLKKFVAPEIRDEARQMLYDYWGQSFVEKMEHMVENEEQNKKNAAPEND